MDLGIRTQPRSAVELRTSVHTMSADDKRTWWDILLTGQQGAKSPAPPPPPPPPPPTLADLFAQLDRDSNGVLSVEEAERAMILLGMCDVSFSDLDLNGDGVLCLEEFEAAFPPESERRAKVLARLESEGGKLQSLYVAPEEWNDRKTAEALKWEQKVQMQAQKNGNGLRQNDILRDELGKG